MRVFSTATWTASKRDAGPKPWDGDEYWPLLVRWARGRCYYSCIGGCMGNSRGAVTWDAMHTDGTVEVAGLSYAGEHAGV